MRCSPIKNLCLFPLHLKASQRPKFKMLKSSHTLPTHSFTSSQVIIWTSELPPRIHPPQFQMHYFQLFRLDYIFLINCTSRSSPSNQLSKWIPAFSFLHKSGITPSFKVILPHCPHDKDLNLCFSLSILTDLRHPVASEEG